MIIDFLPVWLTSYITAFSLILLGLAAEEHYVSRTTAFGNGAALVVFVLSREVSGLLVLYVDGGAILGIIGLGAYVVRTSLPAIYYVVLGFAYGSLPVGCVLLLPMFWALSPVLAVIVLGVAFLLNGYSLFSESWSPIHAGSLPGDIVQFVEDRTISVRGVGPVPLEDILEDW